MPGRDGTGPNGMGPMTGRGIGLCNASKFAGLGLGMGLCCRRGFRRSCFSSMINSENRKDLLMNQKAILEERLNSINNQLNTLQDDLQGDK